MELSTKIVNGLNKSPPIGVLYFFFFWGPEATLFSNI